MRCEFPLGVGFIEAAANNQLCHRVRMAFLPTMSKCEAAMRQHAEPRDIGLLYWARILAILGSYISHRQNIWSYESFAGNVPLMNTRYAHNGQRRGMRARYHALKRRIALARQVIETPPPRPSLPLFIAESGYVFEALRRPFYRIPVTESAHPQTVMLLPGFATHPSRMNYMAKQLRRAGHTVKHWGLGFNMGPSAENIAFLDRRIADLHARYNQKIVLVGWSLGGLFARELAHRHPDKIAKVITMGSPFSGDPRGNNVWRLYQFATGHKVDDIPIANNFRTKPPVETIALWSKRDGIVHPDCACGLDGQRDHAAEVDCTHMGFSGSPAAILAVLRGL